MGIDLDYSTEPPRAARSPRVITDELPILVDTREQLPYDFPGAKRATVRTGDYTIEGYEDRVTVERKSFDDLFGTLRTAAGRDRFRREFERMATMEAALVVVESDLETILAGHPMSALSPASVINTLISWGIRYGVSVWLAGDREKAAAVTYRWLQHFARIAGEAL